MSLVPFYFVDLELAVAETRALTLFKPEESIPAGKYDFLEYFCPDPDCDCRRVMLNVVDERNPKVFLASVSYGFDRDLEDAGPFLDPLNKQSRHARTFLGLMQEVIFTDQAYLARLERHYHMMKAAAADPAHPAYERLRHAIATDPDRLHLDDDGSDARTSRPTSVPRRHVGRNQPCPCGSGRKYKHCCGRR
jgi:hypothetical protein